MRPRFISAAAAVLVQVLMSAEVAFGFNYAIVPGFFAQDHPDSDASAIGALPARLGLLDDSPARWQKFQTRITELNAYAPNGTRYKVIFFARHGEGYHNVAEAKYGTQAWDDYWSKLNGDGEIVWGPDPRLTPLGVSQAEAAREAWLGEQPHGIPIPTSHYLSPLYRAMRTWEVAFVNSTLLCEEKKRALVLENLREHNGVHTCDMRSNRSQIATTFPPPVYSFEDGFAEQDPLWTPDEREDDAQLVARARTVLERIFSRDDATYIAITAHGGIIGGFLGALGRQKSFSLSTGGILPLVVMGCGLDTPATRQ